MKGTVNKVQINFNKIYFPMKTKLTNREQVPFLRSIYLRYGRNLSLHTLMNEKIVSGCRGHKLDKICSLLYFIDSLITS